MTVSGFLDVDLHCNQDGGTALRLDAFKAHFWPYGQNPGPFCFTASPREWGIMRVLCSFRWALSLGHVRETNRSSSTPEMQKGAANRNKDGEKDRKKIEELKRLLAEEKKASKEAVSKLHRELYRQRQTSPANSVVSQHESLFKPEYLLRPESLLKPECLFKHECL
ncbi:hypothetical protein ElyMa_001530300 [Elysia marginata]|uniref:Uncharacterized protein n=1 Tax=Elysia marginata TaxID=1093978 RepID=A0AAV4JAC7_9GAST|nr:hypothetical protein ElyMa_001530300 [Elysia marginata]